MNFTINRILRLFFIIFVLFVHPTLTFAQSSDKKQEEYDKKREKQIQNLKDAEEKALKEHYKMQSPEVRKRMRKSKRQAKRNNPRTHKWYHKIWYGVFRKKVYWD